MKRHNMDHILVVDDDKNILKVIKMRLEAEAYHVVTAMTAGEALKTAANDVFDMALVDLKLKGENGIELMEALHRTNPTLPIIILTAHGSINSAVEAMKRGAYSYITKPFDYPDLLLKIKHCLEKSMLCKEVERLRNIVKDRYGFDNIIGRSEKMQRVLEQVAQASQSDSNVYIEGDSGTGKELIARALHVASQRNDQRFVAVNCAAIPETLIESELFGFEKGRIYRGHPSKKRSFCSGSSRDLFSG